MTITEYKCPLCNEKMTAYPDAAQEQTGSKRDARVFGFTLRCENPCDPQCHENVYGHGVTIKEAYEKAKEKYIKKA